MSTITMGDTRTSNFQNLSSIHSYGKQQLVVIISLGTTSRKLQLNGATTPTILKHPLEGASTPN